MMKKKIVIKLGGSSLDNESTLQELSSLIKGYQKRNFDVVLVHGGGPAINKELTRKGIQWQFINGQRQTTPEMMTVIEDVLAGQVNAQIVESLKSAGIHSIGLSGAKHKILFCTQASQELNRVGKVEQVETSVLLDTLLQTENIIPVIAPIGYGENRKRYNINADWAAVKIAIQLKAQKLIFLTDQNGILDQDKNLINLACARSIEGLIETGVISGGMQTKVLAMILALQSGVKEVRVLNASNSSQLHRQKNTGTLLVNALIAKKKEEIYERVS